MTGLVAAFDTTVFLHRLQPNGLLLHALWTTVYISVTAQAVGTLLGVASALGGLSRVRAARFLSGLYVWFVRGTPVIVQIFFMSYGANLLLGFELFPRNVDLGFALIGGSVLAGIAALSINEGAYMSEFVRAGIMSVDVGQMEAARSLGMTKWLAMRRIVLPQAARVIVPSLGNEFNNMLKTSSLVSFIGVYELFQDAQVAQASNFHPTETFLAVALWYLVLTTIWTLVQVQIERYLGASDRQGDEPWYTRIFGIRPVPGAYA